MDDTIEVTGPSALHGAPVVLDLRPAAARQRLVGLIAALREEWVATSVETPLTPQEVAALLDVAPLGHDVLVLADDETCEPQAAMWHAALLARPDALLVHTGPAPAAVATRRLVLPAPDAADDPEQIATLVRALGPASAPGGAV